MHRTRKSSYIYWLIAAFISVSCSQGEGRKTVVCIPVYGQSLALGEEAGRVTSFDTLTSAYQGRILTENLDYCFGYFDENETKQWLKKMLHYRKRSFELSVYGMAESLASRLGSDTLICIFPGGRGATVISDLSKSTAPYNRLLSDIEKAYHKANEKGWRFYVPAICWMQGESDVFDYTHVDYKSLLKKFCTDINHDIKSITRQEEDVRIICYQTNLITCGERYRPGAYSCEEMGVPEAMMELICEDSLFWASGPTYPYSFVRELKHIDGISQKRLGYQAAIPGLAIIRGDTNKQFKGLIPLGIKIMGNDIEICYNVPTPPLVLDTILVKKAENYGFSVLTKRNKDIITHVAIEHDKVRISCMESPAGCRLRYAVNGKLMKSGWEHGPRGNLRDSQGNFHKAVISGVSYPLYNWSYQFDMGI